MILPGADAVEAMRVAESVRSAVEATAVTHENLQLNVTLCGGIAVFDPETDLRTSKYMIERADRALYGCKRAGRNCVQVYDPAVHAV